MGLIVSNKGLDILKKLKGKTIVSICADDWKDYNRSYGNIKIEIKNSSIVVENGYRDVSYFGMIEELAGYDINTLKDKKFDSLVMKEDLYMKKINKKIVGIDIFRDSITIDYIDKDEKEVYKIDQAIIFKFEEMKFSISQTSIFTPMSKIIFSNDAEKGVKSIDEVKSDWIDDDYENKNDSEKYIVRVERKIIEI